MIVYYLTLADIIAIHDMQIEAFGGGDGLRDPGALESALFRPQSGYYTDLIQEASALWESLSQSHPFVDGNKRTAFVAMVVFLSINNIELAVSDMDAKAFVVECYRGWTQLSHH